MLCSAAATGKTSVAVCIYRDRGGKATQPARVLTLAGCWCFVGMAPAASRTFQAGRSGASMSQGLASRGAHVFGGDVQAAPSAPALLKQLRHDRDEALSAALERFDLVLLRLDRATCEQGEDRVAHGDAQGPASDEAGQGEETILGEEDDGGKVAVHADSSTTARRDAQAQH